MPAAVSGNKTASSGHVQEVREPPRVDALRSVCRMRHISLPLEWPIQSNIVKSSAAGTATKIKKTTEIRLRTKFKTLPLTESAVAHAIKKQRPIVNAIMAPNERRVNKRTSAQGSMHRRQAPSLLVS
jgi:hypothetical protein